MATQPLPSVGRSVHYASGTGTFGEPDEPVCYAAIITKVYDPTNPTSPVDLVAFPPGHSLPVPAVSVSHAASPQAHSWHWQEFVPPSKEG